MSTLAAWYEEPKGNRGATTSGDGYDGNRGHAENLYRVRPLPNEDICLWQTPVDNSKVVRQTDPQVWGACWRFITASSIVAIVVVGLLVPNAYGVLAGYRLHKLQQENVQLAAEQRQLKMEETSLLRPERLEQVAVERGLKDPEAGMVYQLAPVNDQSVARVSPAR
ncbi:MAG: hypothetical protein JJE04_01550 [Acidobacteriia bacterium]|nr:hypothetical protein [Terriglobia bacterium]